MADFSIEKKIYYYDTDAGGVVYYANYLKHLEEGRNEFCRGKGVDLAELSKSGVEFPVVHVEVDYKSPARYGDTVKVYTRIEKVGGSSVHFSQEIKRDETLLVRAKTVWACIDKQFKGRPVPEQVKDRLLA
ncbi:MAG: thioesterase family protein [Candidatus Omnitrophica bacterium]|jgi:acyl-CoA thioester hydrolase|nr:acyl-CoA thioesterase [Candidatus Omnitrophota bacterium]MDD5079513.1 thioesterase family protein [Candidatus Omnitrophota bacterium]